MTTTYKIPRLSPPAEASDGPVRQPAPPKPALATFSGKKVAPVPVLAKRTTTVGLKGVAGPGPLPGKTLFSCVRDELDSASDEMTDDGFFMTKRQSVARSLVRMAMIGSFAHQKEIMDRENGKVPDRVAGADGQDLKLYIGMPLDGPDSP